MDIDAGFADQGCVVRGADHLILRSRGLHRERHWQVMENNHLISVCVFGGIFNFLITPPYNYILICCRYYSDCKETNPSEFAQNDYGAKKLWELSAELTGLGQDLDE